MLVEFAKQKPKHSRPKPPARPKGMQTMSAAVWALIRRAVAGAKSA